MHDKVNESHRKRDWEKGGTVSGRIRRLVKFKMPSD